MPSRLTRVFQASLLTAGIAFLSLAARDVSAQTPAKLLLQAVAVTATPQEYIAIYNPNNQPVDLSNYYITDAWHVPDTYYIYIANRSAGVAGGGTFSDFHIRFPAGATIAAHDTIAVAHQSAPIFQTTYGRKPAFEIAFASSSDPTVPDMRPAFPGSVPGVPDSTTLSNSGEMVTIYYWDGQSDLVTDVDYLMWGANTGSFVVDKTGKSIDGPDVDSTPTAYQADTAPANQVPVAATHSPGNSFRRVDFNEGTQKTTGGNGVDGRDETSENLSTTWTTDTARPPFVKGSQPVQLAARPGGPYTGTVNAPISFNGSASTAPTGQTITTYAWNFGDGGTGSGVTPTHAYAAAGTFTVSLTVTASGGGTNTATTTATVAGAQALTARTGGPYSGTVNSAISFDGSASTPAAGETITGYAWNFGDSGTGSGDTPSHTYTTAGSYTVTLTVTGSGGGTNTATTTATVSGGVEPGAAKKLLLQAVAVTATPQEYIAIYNPNAESVDLSNYYITDAWHVPDTYYIYITNRSAGIAGGGTFSDFHVRFPAGATIAAYDTIAIAHVSAPNFTTTYGRKPAFEIAFSSSNDPTVPDMRPAFPGSVPGVPDSTTLSNGGEMVTVYYWDGASDLVTDVDYLLWGVNTGTYVVDKTGKSIDGPDVDSTPTAYKADTAPANQVPVASTHSPGNAFRRVDFNEGTQRTTGGNGVGGRDETSENLSATWTTDAAKPPFVKSVQPSQLTARPGGPYSGIAGSSINFSGATSTAPTGQTITTYAWTFGDGQSGTGVTTTHIYAAAGTFTVTLTVTASGGGTHSATTTATISAAGQLTALPGGPYSGTTGTPVSFNGSGSTPKAGETISNYAWNFGDGGTGTGSTTTHTYTLAGTYTVTLTVTGSGGGTNTGTTSATITGAVVLTGALQVPARTFIPTRGEDMKIAIDPTEVGGNRVTLRVYDLEGREVKILFDGDLNSKKSGITWDGRDDQLMYVPAGTYICHLEIRDDRGHVHNYTAPIVVARRLERN